MERYRGRMFEAGRIEDQTPAKQSEGERRAYHRMNARPKGGSKRVKQSNASREGTRTSQGSAARPTGRPARGYGGAPRSKDRAPRPSPVRQPPVASAPGAGRRVPGRFGSGRPQV